jgi:PAS domain S-box-containing protein
LRVQANEQTIPRINLIGTLAIVTVLTLSLGAYFSWRNASEHQASLERIAHTGSSQQEAQLRSEMDSAISYINFTRQRTDEVLRRSIREQVETGIQVANAIFQRESGHRPAAEIQKLIIETLRPVRFYDGRGYYFIDDMVGKFILLPTAPQLEGKTILDNKDDKGNFIMRGLIDAARKPQGQGFSRYRWYSPDSPKEMTDKLAYVQYFAPYEWLIGTGDYTYKWEEMQKKEAIERLRSLRFGNSGYMGSIDAEGRSLLSPSNEALEGKHFSAMEPVEAGVMQQMFELAHNGGGVLHYSWRIGADRHLVAKTAFIRHFEPWGWTVISTVDDSDLQKELRSELALHDADAQKRWSEFGVALLLALALGLGGSFAFARWSRQLFKRYQDDNQAKSRAIHDSEALFRAVFENAAVGIAQVAPDGRFLQINESYCKIIGYEQEEVLRQGFTFQRLTHEDDLAVDASAAQKMVKNEINTYTTEKRYVHKSGALIWVRLASHVVRANGVAMYFITAVYDITDQKKYEDKLKLASTVFTHAREGITITDAAGTIIDVNDTFTDITGYLREEVIGQNPRVWSSGRQEPEFYTNMWRALTEKGHWYGEIWNRRKSGEIYAQMLTISAVPDGRGTTGNYVALFSDITVQKDYQSQLEHIAHYDALTGLPNRVLLADRLKQAMTQALRRGERVAIAYLDIDGFKNINDRHGHHVGDQLLIAITNAMKQALREGDTLARLGGR